MNVIIVSCLSYENKVFLLRDLSLAMTPKGIEHSREYLQQFGSIARKQGKA